MSDLDLHSHMAHKQDAMLKIEFIMKYVLQKIDNTCNVRKVAKIKNRCIQVPHLTQATTWESDKAKVNKLDFNAKRCRSNYSKNNDDMTKLA